MLNDEDWRAQYGHIPMYVYSSVMITCFSLLANAVAPVCLVFELDMSPGKCEVACEIRSTCGDCGRDCSPHSTNGGALTPSMSHNCLLEVQHSQYTYTHTVPPIHDIVIAGTNHPQQTTVK
jgi:hypothetical protein